MTLTAVLSFILASAGCFLLVRLLDRGESVDERLAGIRRRHLSESERGAREVQAKSDEEAEEARDQRPLLRRLVAWLGDRLDRLGGPVKRVNEPLERLLRRAHLRLRVSEFWAISLVICLAAVVAGLLAGLPALVAVVAGAAGFYSPYLYVQSIYTRRLKQFERQLPDALSLITSSLKSGYSFLQAIQVVADELGPPMTDDFRLLVKETSVGISTADALANLLDRVESDDLDLVITAILIHQQVGGNLAQVLDNIGGTIRGRMEMESEVKALTAQGRLSGWIISLLPVGLLFMTLALDPGYIQPMLHNPLGWGMLAGGALMELIGILVVRNMVQLEF